MAGETPFWCSFPPPRRAASSCRVEEESVALRGLTFLQSLDLLLCEAGPVPLQLPLELQPQLRLLAIVPLHGDSSSARSSSSSCFPTHAALWVQHAALRPWQRARWGEMNMGRENSNKAAAHFRITGEFFLRQLQVSDHFDFDRAQAPC